jgi:hypothetical protein
MNKIARVVFVLVILGSMGLFLLPTRIFATGNTYYVSTTGSDSNNGLGTDNSHAWLTINHAAQVMVAGDTVNIEAGTYSGEIIPANSGTAVNPITYTNYNSGSVIINDTGLNLGGQGAVYINNLSYITFGGSSPSSKITIENVFNYCIGGVYANNGSHIVFQNLYIQDTDLSGIAAYYCSGITINNCELYHCNHQAGQECISLVADTLFEVENCSVHDAVDTTGRVGIDAKEANTNGSIHNNTVYNIPNGFCIYVDGGYTGGGINSQNINIYDNICHNGLAGLGAAVETGDANLVNINYYNNICYSNTHGVEVDGGIASEVLGISFINNTFYHDGDATASGSDFILYGTHINYNAVIRNNIIDDATSGMYAIKYNDYANGGVTIDHNLFYNSGGSWNAGNVLGTSYQSGNPNLSSPTTSFALTSSSTLAIDNGSATSAPATDYIGTSRPQGIGYDIGAYEYIITPVTVSTSATSNITNNTATLNGNISNMGSETSVTVTFQYGFTTAYGQTATASESPMTTVGTFHANVTGLSTGTVYHFRVKIVGITTVYTSDAQFTTTGTAGTNPYLVINQVSFDNYVVGQINGDNKIINSTGGGTTTTTTTTTSTTTTSTTTTTGIPLIPQSTGSLLVKYLLPLAIILVTIFMVFRYWKNPILLICYFVGLMLMLILALYFTNLL